MVSSTCLPQHKDAANVKMRHFLFQARNATGVFQDNNLWQRQACEHSSHCIPNLQQKGLEQVRSPYMTNQLV